MADQNDWIGMIRDCEAKELNGEADLPSTRVHMMYCLLANDLNRARFLWKRAHGTFQKDTELKALWAIGQALWHKDWAAAFAVRVPGTGEIEKLLPLLQETTRMRVLFLIASAYQDIKVDAAAGMLGLSAQDTVTFCTGFNWQHAGDLLTPCETEVREHDGDRASMTR
eukprot:TRINITY_DN545_c0_g1_i21.p1 TRINITY_DN545_c0_g1~~TRINITY_DN545_c0_g1_i21.p1  ORF type:complete len:168 (-),score=26.69 TRINITY_DN545_c0_g1_i21:370-873(-)